MTEFHVCAIGNALVDVIADATDDFLKENGIAKGGMTLIDAERAGTLYDLIGPAMEMSGGSAANTVAGIASLGGRASFMGKVKADQLGAIFRHDLHAQRVHFGTAPTAERRQAIQPVANERRAGAPTGRCIILVTPDAQRSMNTYLGAGVEFGPDDIQADVIQQAAVTYLEGYLFDPPEAKKAFHMAAKLVREAGRKLSLTLSATFCVERHRDEFQKLVKSSVDILFANENELKALYKTDDIDAAIAAVRNDCEIAVTTRSEKGALITTGAQVIEVPAAHVDKVIDTTGAGDLYAAGFLYGYTQGKTLAESGRIGAVAAAEVISHYGPRPKKKLSDLIAA